MRHLNPSPYLYYFDFVDFHVVGAEHLMLLDLGRNDAGRVAVAGSVTIKEKFSIECYSHIMHILPQVEGLLQSGLSAIYVLRVAFTAGTPSGAAKI